MQIQTMQHGNVLHMFYMYTNEFSCSLNFYSIFT